MYKHILVPTDGSERSRNTVRRALSFAKEAQARVTAIYAKPRYPTTYYGEGVHIDTITLDKFEKLTEEHAEEVLSFVENLCREEGVPCAAMALANDFPHLAILDAAKQCGCDLIFMASHGRSEITTLLLGSETHKVLALSTIPVLVYRSPE